jgi:hypothetical protein
VERAFERRMGISVLKIGRTPDQEAVSDQLSCRAESLRIENFLSIGVALSRRGFILLTGTENIGSSPD